MVAELGASIFARELPPDARLGTIRSPVPGVRFALESRQRVKPAVAETSTAHQTGLDFGLTEPAPVLRRVMHRGAPPEPAAEAAAP